MAGPSNGKKARRGGRDSVGWVPAPFVVDARGRCGTVGRAHRLDRLRIRRFHIRNNGCPQHRCKRPGERHQNRERVADDSSPCMCAMLIVVNLMLPGRYPSATVELECPAVRQEKCRSITDVEPYDWNSSD